MISKTIFVIQINLFVKWMTQNTLSFVINGDGSKIATYGHCTIWMLYVYKIKQFYSFCEKTHCINLFVSISNQQCASSQNLFWMLQPCFVLKSRPQKKQKNFSSFPLSSRLFLITISRFGLLAVGLCSFGQQ